MGGVHIWLKRSYIVVISLIVIISLLLLGISFAALHQHKEVEQNLKVIHFMYIFAFVIIVWTIFGAFGVWKEKKWALIVFAVGMILSSLFMLVITIPLLVALPKITEYMKEHYTSLLPLANATEHFSDLQTNLECCGIEGYQDWNSSIPESCLCTNKSTNPCVAAPRNSSLFNGQNDDVPVMIYEKGCHTYIIKLMSLVRIILGVMLGISLLWVLSIVLCIAILCKLDRNKDSTAVN